MTKYFSLAIILAILIGCKPETVERVVEVPIPSAPPINQPPPLEPERPDFVNFDQLEQFALNDLNSLNETDRINTRYLIVCNDFNRGQKSLDRHFQGIQKGINQISQNALPAFSTPIDPADCMYRFDLRDIGTTRSLWQDFERNNLVGFISQSTRGVTLRFLTQANQPIVFASSFMVTVLGADQLSQGNGLYYRFTGQADRNIDFFRDIGFNAQREFDEENVHCAGGGRSQIAIGKTRQICVCEGCTNDGFMMWTSDTTLVNPDSVLANPFSIQMAKAGGSLNSDKIFDAAAGEFIFSMRNGLLTGYRLSNLGGVAGPDINLGTSETVAPTDIVLDLENASAGLDTSILLGACGNCHHTDAAIFFQDQVFNQVLQTGGFDAQEKNLAEVFFRNDAFQATLANANRIHQETLRRIGVDPNQPDPVTNVLMQPLRKELDAAAIASYTFLPTNEFLQRLNGTNDAKIIFGALISGGTVQFSDFANNFDVLINDLNLFRDRNQL